MNELDLKEQVNLGKSLGELAQHFGRSKTSIKFWLKKFKLQTSFQSGEKTTAKFDGTTFICPKHGNTDFYRQKGKYVCKRCNSDRVSERRRRLKEELVEYKGGKCISCGYDAYIGALEFHHLDRNTKEIALSSRGLTRSIDTLKKEVDKCVLLCANCHREVEAGIRQI